MKKFKVTRWCNEIEEVEATRETELTVWYMRNPKHGNSVERSERKASNYGQWFDSLEDAQTYIHVRINCKIDSLEKKLGEAKNELYQFNNKLAEGVDRG